MRGGMEMRTGAADGSAVVMQMRMCIDEAKRSSDCGDREAKIQALQPTPMGTLDKLVGLAMLVVATVVFLYYTIWTLLMPFVDSDHPLQNFFPPRVWAIRIPVILILLGSAVVGSFLSVVMIRSNRKKAAKAAAAAAAAGSTASKKKQ
ncbi:putative dolichol phosphate-mannose biosynthesis regulatory protein [Thermochaetoides thermophila DSM 1495]|uniref:Dolichol phosphate-mannose biosynthesis regulatory protein n=1 Tax=Chaetomium thermophilum (strain DSM 1495 / CBS 144.50 / IMI 039719) TaxID=759272 RepID=G0S5X0_CHATD|nr:putative dolichol phosphate-mannose biosynthesis regulatory protein [Thermochaetoides thermophila DSM 1495]EGS20686.1 putative dolichol phosphate-mannose biosynthesis regulatory protein [Thermochaetoides thermophila DSM 1495]